MRNGQSHGIEVEIDSIRSAFARPHPRLRQAHDVLSGALPVEAATPAIRDASGPSMSTSSKPN